MVTDNLDTGLQAHLISVTLEEEGTALAWVCVCICDLR